MAASPRMPENHMMNTPPQRRVGTGAGEQALREFLASRTNQMSSGPMMMKAPPSAGDWEGLTTISDRWTVDSSLNAMEGGESLWQKWLREAKNGGGHSSLVSPTPKGPSTPHAQEHAPVSRSFQASTSPRRSLQQRQMPEETAEAVVLRRRMEHSGVFGVGLQLSADTPHVVQRATRLTDPDGRDANASVNEGDWLVGIDGCPVEMASIEIIEQLLVGEQNTTVRLTLGSAKTQQNYDVVVVRHVPIRAWEEEHFSYEVRQDLRGKDLSVNSDIVRVLEEARAIVCDPTGEIKDFLKVGKHAQTTVGFRIVKMPLGLHQTDGSRNACIVDHVVTGSAPHMEGDVVEGDEVLAVDGVSVEGRDEDAIIDQLNGGDVVGTKCRLTMMREGRRFEVEVVRSSVSFVREMERLCWLLEEHAQLIKRQAGQEPLIASAQAVMDHALGMEQHRVQHERQLSERLEGATAALKDRLLSAIRMLHQPVADGANNTAMNAQMQRQLEDERMARVGAEARALDWERRLEVLKELVMVLRGPPSVSPNKLAQAITASGLSPKDVVQLLHNVGAQGTTNISMLTASDPPVVARLEAQYREAQEARVRAEAEANVLRKRCESLQRQVSELEEHRISSKESGIERQAPARDATSRAGTSADRSAAHFPYQRVDVSLLPAPHLHPPGGRVKPPAVVRIVSSVPNAVIHYTCNGSLPTATHYEGFGPSPLAVTISSTCTIRAVVSVDGKVGGCASGEYVLEPVIETLAGVGLLLERSDHNRTVNVKSIMPGGAAALNGTIQVWDRLLAVDGRDVESMDLSHILDLVKGPEGSQIVLTMSRDGSTNPASTPASSRSFTVALTRTSVQGVGIVGSFSSPNTSRSPSPVFPSGALPSRIAVPVSPRGPTGVYTSSRAQVAPHPSRSVM